MLEGSPSIRYPSSPNHGAAAIGDSTTAEETLLRLRIRVHNKMSNLSLDWVAS